MAISYIIIYGSQFPHGTLKHEDTLQNFENVFKVPIPYICKVLYLYTEPYPNPYSIP